MAKDGNTDDSGVKKSSPKKTSPAKTSKSGQIKKTTTQKPKKPNANQEILKPEFLKPKAADKRDIKKEINKVMQSTASAASKVGEATMETGQKVAKKIEKEFPKMVEKSKRGLISAFRATRKASKKAAGLVDIKVKISGRRLKIDQLLKKIGELYCQQQMEKTEVREAELKSHVLEIDKIKDEIKDLNEERERVIQS